MSLALDWLRPAQAEDPMRYLDDVFRYAHARLGQREDAEDVAIEVVQALPNPCRRKDLRLYMIGMARRKVADRLRRRRSTELIEGDACLRTDLRVDRAAVVGETLAALTEDHREALIMKYVIGLSSEEIGTLTGRKAAAVDNLLQRARDAFARQWEALGLEDER
jgi:RNA polymerase sigma-70 factor (ECF subfamily)